MLTAWIAPATDRETLLAFYRKVRPFGPGWRPIRRALEAHEAAEGKSSAVETGENIPLALLGWSAGCTVIWSSLFAVGSFLYGRVGQAFGLSVVFLASAAALIWVVNRVWDRPEISSIPSRLGAPSLRR